MTKKGNEIAMFRSRMMVPLLLFLTVVVSNSLLFVSLPRMITHEVTADFFQLEPVSASWGTLFRALFWFAAIFGVAWTLGAFLLHLGLSRPLLDSFIISGHGLAVFVLPILSGDAVIQGYRLFNGAIILSFIAYVLWIRSQTCQDGGAGDVSRQNVSLKKNFTSIGRLIVTPVFSLILVSVLIPLLASGLLVQIEGATGDEPNYLIVAHSLVVDHDIDLKNNYEQESYRLFYPDHLYHRVTVDSQGRWLPSQGIGLPLLLAPAYWLGLKAGNVTVACRLMVSFCAVLTLIAIVLLFRRDLGFRGSEFWGIVAVVGTSPFLLYSHQIYPEIPGALLLTLTVLGSSDSHRGRAIASGIAAGLLPWLGIKFLVPLAAVMGIWFIHGIVPLVFRSSTWDRDRAFASLIRLGTSLIMVVAFFGLFYQLYGTFNFVKTHGIKGTEASGFGGSLSWSITYGIQHLEETLRIASGYLFDQRVGICIYSPLFLLLGAGIIIGFKRFGLFQWQALAIVSSHWALFAWTGQWEGYCPPTRYLVPLAPFFASWLGLVFVASWRSRRRWIAQFLLVASLGIAVFMMLNLHRFYHFVLWRNPDEVNHQLALLSNSLIDWTVVFPSFTRTELPWLSILSFVSLMILVTIVFVRSVPIDYSTAQLRRDSFRFWLLTFTVILLAARIQAYAESFPNYGHCFSTMQKDDLNICLVTADCYPPEPDGVWLRGGGSVRPLIAAESLGTTESSSFLITVHSLVRNDLMISTGTLMGTVHLEPDHRITIAVPCMTINGSAQGGDAAETHACSPWIRCSRGIKPAEMPGNSTDERNLGCYLRFSPDSTGNPH